MIVVTHSSTVGASIDADYLLCARKEVGEGRVTYRIFTGHPTDKLLRSVDGATIANHQVLLTSLEAGEEAYEARRRGYEAVKD